MSMNQLIEKSIRLNLTRCAALANLGQYRSVGTKALTLHDDEVDKILKKDDTGSSSKITLTGPENVSSITGIPEEHVKERLVRIYQTSKNPMQSGTENAGHWEMEFETRARWENPLMGWSSTGDPQSNVKVQFNDKSSAIRYAEKNGWQWFLEPEKKVKPKVKSYGFNFSWNKRTRASTK